MSQIFPKSSQQRRQGGAEEEEEEEEDRTVFFSINFLAPVKTCFSVFFSAIFWKVRSRRSPISRQEQNERHPDFDYLLSTPSAQYSDHIDLNFDL
jgi:hypothetical protein